MTRLETAMVGGLSRRRRTSTDEEADATLRIATRRARVPRSRRPAFQFDCPFDPGQNGSMDDAHGRRNLPSR
jgi:hypothetical protein